MRTRIVGSRYYPGASTALAGIRARTVLRLVPEPDNPHDKDAIAVHLPAGPRSSVKLGHLPRNDAAAVARALREGLSPECRAWLDGADDVVVEWLSIEEEERLKEDLWG